MEGGLMSFAEAAVFEKRDYASEKQLRGRIIKLHTSSDTFSAGILKATDGPIIASDCRFRIFSRVHMDEDIILSGRWKNDPKWGWQFQADGLEYPMPEVGTAGLAEYLATNPAFRGLGPVKAKKIAETFGDNFDQVIRDSPEVVAEVGKITLEQAEILRSEWCARADVNAIAQWLASFGLTHCQICKIAERYGNRAKQILEENPYVLCRDVYGFGFSRTDEIALKMGIRKDHPGRIQACLVDLVQSEAEEGGHTYVTRGELVRSALKKLCFDTLDAENLVREQLEAMCADDASQLMEVERDGSALISWRDMYEKEMQLLGWMQEANADLLETDADYIPCAIEKAAADAKQTPSDSQRVAAEMVLGNRISVISGGAGTGKSFTIALVYRIFHNATKRVGLCAPTGKAAKRMSQLADGAEAKTIHRLLEYNPMDGWGYNADNKLPHDLIIVDEVSMCDIHLLWRLLSAIDFSKTQLLMVGDHNQLPPIGAGNALRDILDHKIVPCHILSECFRNAGQLKANCNSLLDGKLEPTTPVLPQGGREWRVVNSLEDPEELIEHLRCLMEKHFALWGFDPISDCQIITPYNKGKLGVNRINLELQRVWQRMLYENSDGERGALLPEVVITEKREPRPQLMVGDKVMQIKNDYKLGDEGVMNGTTGVVQDIYDGFTPKGEPARLIVVNFDDAGIVEIEAGSDKEKNVVLAYAFSVHKAQGSEYPCVVAVIHKMHSYMLNRSLFYTAVTRAKKTAIMMGERVGMRRAITNVASAERRTWMSLLGVDSGADIDYTTSVEAS
jgi:exodeoxyribonuclease V alpha subunit